jgi:tetrapyrrole methylase family protein/MazG family protein
LVARLRSPKGCPWDRKQTHLSLIKFLREEAQELEKALRRGQGHEIEDELGDLLLQVLLHAQIAREKGRFDIQDVALSQYRKLVRRHPHVFGRAKLRTAGEVLDSWSAIKREERSQRRKDLRRRRRAA